LAFFLDFSFIPSVAVSPYAEFADGRAIGREKDSNLNPKVSVS